MISNLSALHALIITVGVISITRLVTADTFPPILAVRNAVLRRWPYAGFVSDRPISGRTSIRVGDNYVAQETTVIGSLLHCPYCIGFWISAAVVGAWSLWPTVVLWGCFIMSVRWVTGAALNRFD